MLEAKVCQHRIPGTHARPRPDREGYVIPPIPLGAASPPSDATSPAPTFDSLTAGAHSLSRIRGRGARPAVWRSAPGSLTATLLPKKLSRGDMSSKAVDNEFRLKRLTRTFPIG